MTDRSAVWLASRARNMARDRAEGVLTTPRRGPVCGWCGTALPTWRAVRGAQYCATRCTEQAAGARTDRTPAERFPYTHRADEVSSRCARCGGPWRRVPSGVSCLLCGQEVLIAECLDALATRSL